MDPGPGTKGPNGPWAWARVPMDLGPGPGSQWTLGLGHGPNGPWAWDPGSLAPSLAVVVAVASLIPPLSCPDQMCVVARQDLCCGKTRSLLWLDKTSVVARHKGGGLRPPPQRGAAFGRPPLWIPYVLPQQRSCLATAEILSCHSRDLVLPQHTSGPATTGILPCHIRPGQLGLPLGLPLGKNTGRPEKLLGLLKAPLGESTDCDRHFWTNHISTPSLFLTHTHTRLNCYPRCAGGHVFLTDRMSLMQIHNVRPRGSLSLIHI